MPLPNFVSTNVFTLCVHSVESFSMLPFNLNGCPMPFVSAMSSLRVASIVRINADLSSSARTVLALSARSRPRIFSSVESTD